MVLGGGYGGIDVAQALDDVADVVLVEPKDAFVHNVAALRALADPAWLPRIYLPYDRLLSRGRVVQDRAVKADAGRGHPRLRRGDPRRLLVLATGSQYPFPAKSDADDAAHRPRAGPGRARRARRGPAACCWSAPARSASSWPARSRPVWPGKQVTLLDAADDILGARFRPDLKAELRRQLTAAGVERPAVQPAARSCRRCRPAELGEFTVADAVRHAR